MLTTEEKETLVNMICKEQNDMIIKDYNSYQKDQYKKLEALKIKIKSMEEN